MSGMVAGTWSTYAGFPMDTVKVKMQLSRTNVLATDVFLQIVQKDGFLSLFRGVVSPVTGNAPIIAVLFAVNECAKSNLKEFSSSKPLNNFICGWIAGFCVSFIQTPVDLLKINKQVNAKQNSYFQIARQKYMRYGIKGLFQGYSPTMMRTAMPNGVMFTLNSIIQDYLNVDPSQNSTTSVTLKKLVSGGLSGQAFWLSGYPFDVIKSFVQSRPKHVSMKAAFKFLYRKHGVCHFYRGISVTMVRAFPVSAINFLTYEFISKKLKQNDLIN
jgi:ornithine carrier protein